MSGVEEPADSRAIDDGSSIAGRPAAHAAEHTAGTGAVPGERGDTGGEGASVDSLIEESKAREYQARWNQLKGEFVDDPQHVVRGVDRLVSEVLDELEQVFRTQRGNLESAAGDGASTEELRVAFGKYREFFDKLLSI